MGDLWTILLVVLGIVAIVAGVRLATGNKPWSDNNTEPTSPPADPGAEGMRVAEPGEIVPGAPEDDDPEASGG